MTIKKYVDDPTLTWEQRYARLEAHHVEETQALIEQRDVARQIAQDLLSDREHLSDADCEMLHLHMEHWPTAARLQQCRACMSGHWYVGRCVMQDS